MVRRRWSGSNVVRPGRFAPSPTVAVRPSSHQRKSVWVKVSGRWMFPAACHRVGETTGGAAHDERRGDWLTLLGYTSTKGTGQPSGQSMLALVCTGNGADDQRIISVDYEVTDNRRASDHSIESTAVLVGSAARSTPTVITSSTLDRFETASSAASLLLSSMTKASRCFEVCQEDPISRASEHPHLTRTARSRRSQCRCHTPRTWRGPRSTSCMR